MLLFGMFLIPNAHTNITEIDIDFQVGKCNVDTAYSTMPVNSQISKKQSNT